MGDTLPLSGWMRGMGTGLGEWGEMGSLAQRSGGDDVVSLASYLETPVSGSKEIGPAGYRDCLALA